MADLKVFRAKRAIVDAERPVSVHVLAGRIVDVAVYDGVPPAALVIDAGDAVLLPGLVETHVHANEPGRTMWEGFASATWAGAAGGITTLVDMPLNSLPPATTVEALAAKRDSVQGQLAVDVGFGGEMAHWGCRTKL